MGIKIIAENRKAYHDYTILEKFEAGLVLTGGEVKSLRNNQCQLKDAYVVFQFDEAWLQGVHISGYKYASYNDHAPERRRKLLLHKREIEKLYATVKEKGLTIVPLKVYFKEGRAKVEIALAKGKKAHDKRASIKERDVKREIDKRLKSR